MPESNALRHELADHHVRERQDEVREQHGEDRRYPFVEGMRERLLSEGADAERRERDAELHRGDELRRVGCDPQHGTGAPVALVVQLDDPRPPRRDEGVLRRHEEGVGEDQDPDADELECEGHAPNLGA